MRDLWLALKENLHIFALAPILLELNSYITTIDICFVEISKDAHKRVKNTVENTQAVTKFHDLLQQFQGFY